MSPRSLEWWRWRLKTDAKRGAAVAKPTKRRMRKVAALAVSPMTFVEMSAALPVEPLEVVVGSEHRVRVPVAFDAATLDRLLDVLERRR